MQTCAQLYEHVHQIDDVTSVVEDKPDNDSAVSELPENRASDDDEQVVQHCC